MLSLWARVRDRRRDRLPPERRQLNTVIPNGCDDGEAACKPVNDRYTQFDDFLAREIPQIEASYLGYANQVGPLPATWR